MKKNAVERANESVNRAGTTQLTLRVNASTFQKLEVYAEAQGASINQWAAALIAAALEEADWEDEREENAPPKSAPRSPLPKSAQIICLYDRAWEVCVGVGSEDNAKLRLKELKEAYAHENPGAAEAVDAGWHIRNVPVRGTL